MTDEHLFSVEEANALLPDLRRSLVAVQKARQVVLSGGERVRRSASANGGGRQGQLYWEALGALRREVEAITARGIVLRDADTGLLDFPTRREGTEAFLCWRLGEDRVEYWHGPDTGLAGRQPL